jgi:hypothetical protein
MSRIRPYPEGSVAWDEAFRQRQRADDLEAALTWQPIRTAPTDGTWFLCHKAGPDGVIRISSAHWEGGFLGGKGWCYSTTDMPQYWMPISERFAE